MRTKWILALMVAVLVAGVLDISMAKTPAKTATTDYEALAQRLVLQCAGIEEGDRVLIFGGVRDLELLENLAVNVRKQGAFPLVRISSDRMTRRMYTDVPAKYDTQSPEFTLKLANIITAEIGVEFGESPDLLADIPVERRAAISQTFQPVEDLVRKRNVRGVFLGNDLYPTAARAKLYGISQEELAKIFWAGVNMDYTKLQSAGQALKATLAGGKEVHITNPNGTDLKVRIEGRSVYVSDGVISADDQKIGGAACQVWLPAGEVYVTPVPGTAEGMVVVDRHFFEGKEIQGLTLTFKAGKLTSMTAKSGLESLKALYDASGAGKEDFGAIDVGINPNVKIPPGSRMVAWMPAGMITIGIGNNTWAGGENNVNFTLYTFLPGSTLTVDGKMLAESGELEY